MKIAKGAWIVVCDGGTALIFENTGSPSALKLEPVEVSEHKGTPTRDAASDHPGRVHSAVGTARSAVDQTDWHDVAEREFLESLTHRLDAAIAAGDLSDLVVVAAPRALGMLRAAYSPAIRQVLRGEIDKDYVKTPVGEIEKHLAG